MPKKSSGDKGGRGQGAGGWQVDNVNRVRDNRRVVASPRDRRINKTNKKTQTNDARMRRANEKARAKAKGKGCAVTAFGIGLTLSSVVASWKGLS